MKQVPWLALAFLGFCLSTGRGMAIELKGIDFPDEITVKNKSLVLNGLGLRQMTIFKVNVYIAALYLTVPSTEEREILKSEEMKQLDIVFLRDVKAEDIVESWNRGFSGNCHVACEHLKPQLERLNSLMANVKKGQRVSFLFLEGSEGFVLSSPGKDPANFEGRAFGEVILSTFIGEVPPTADLKQGVLGLGPWKPAHAPRGLSSVPKTPTPK